MQLWTASCFEVFGSREHGVAAASRMFKKREASCLLNAPGDVTADGPKFRCLPM